jgi:hypothetical protein
VNTCVEHIRININLRFNGQSNLSYFSSKNMSSDSSVDNVSSFRLDGFSLIPGSFYLRHNVQSGSRAHPPSHKMVRLHVAVPLGVKLPKREANNSPHVPVEWSTLLLRISEFPCSNLGTETGCPERFSSVPPCKCPDSTLN